MRLISKEDLQYAGRVSLAGKSFDSVLRLVLRIFQCFKYSYLVHILDFIFLIWLACFYNIMKRCIFRTRRNIEDTAFCKSKYRLKKLHFRFLAGLRIPFLLNIKLTACPCLLYDKIYYMFEIRRYLSPMCLLLS